MDGTRIKKKEYLIVRVFGCAVYSMYQSALKEAAFKSIWSQSAFALMVQTTLNLSVLWSEELRMLHKFNCT
jgi:hypothetical protein